MAGIFHRECSDTEPWKVRRHPQFKKVFQVVNYEAGSVEVANILFARDYEAQDFADIANELWNMSREKETERKIAV